MIEKYNPNLDHEESKDETKVDLAKFRSEVLEAQNEAKRCYNDAEFLLKKANNSGKEEDFVEAENAMNRAEDAMRNAKELRSEYLKIFEE